MQSRPAGSGAWCLLTTLLLLAPPCQAQFHPVALTPESYTADVIIEKEAPPPLVPVTTASMETGTTNTGLGWYEVGYYLDYTSAGLPQPGVPFNIDLADHWYQMAPSYTEPNALMLDAQAVTGTLSCITPRTCGVVSFLTCSAAGAVTVAYDLHHQDGSVQSGTFSPPDWVSGVPPAWQKGGRIDVQAFTFRGVPDKPSLLFNIDVAVVNSNNPITRVELTRVSGNGRAVVFALSSLNPAAAAEDVFSPIVIEGYNQDLVVEVSAPHRGALPGTTATLEQGFGNGGYTLFERGYLPAAPQRGVPHPGDLLSPGGFPGSAFALATNYVENNAAVIDPTCPAATLALQAPGAYSALVFLAASSHGPVTNSCIVQHADGSRETNAWVAPDYLTGEAPAYTADGRVDVNTRLLDCLGPGQVRLFAVFCTLSNTQSPVTGMDLAYGGAAGSACTVLAVSGVSPGPARPVLSLLIDPKGGFSLSTTMPGVLESASAPDAPDVLWRNEGPIASTLYLVPAPEESCRFYRVRLQ